MSVLSPGLIPPLPLSLADQTPPVVLYTSEPAQSGAAGVANSAAGAAAGQASAEPWSVLVWCVIVLAVLGLSALVSRLAWRGRWREPPAARAAARMARELGLDVAATAMLRRLATALGAEPVALLLSESAFERASAALPRDLSAPDKAALLSLRAKVFGGAHAVHEAGGTFERTEAETRAGPRERRAAA